MGRLCGALLAWAKLAGQAEAARLLEQTLSEEKTADGLLNKLATGKVNATAKAA